MKSKLTLLALFLLSSLCAQNTWTTSTPMPNGLRGSTGFTLNNEGYVLGGIIPNVGYTNMLWKYDVASSQWIQIPSPYPGCGRYKLTYFVLNNLLYVGMGSYSANGACNDWWMFDPITQQWFSRAPFPGSSRTGSSGFAINNKGYIYGGHTFGNVYFSELYEYDPSTNTWTIKASLPSLIGGRTYAATFATTTHGYVVGGQYGDLNNSPIATQEAWRYDPVLDAWSPLQAYPGTGLSPSAISINNCHFVGLGAFSNGFWQYDIAANNWTQMQNHPSPTGTYLPFLFSVNNTAFIGCGMTSTVFTSSTVYEYSPPSSCAIITSVPQTNLHTLTQTGNQLQLQSVIPVLKVIVFDNLGRIVYSANPDTEIITIDLSNNPTGVYFIEIQSQSSTTRKKVAVVRD